MGIDATVTNFLYVNVQKKGAVGAPELLWRSSGAIVVCVGGSALREEEHTM